MVIYIRQDDDRTGVHLAGTGHEGGIFVPVEETVDQVANLISAELDK
jgi:hypothetical protein